MADPSQYRPALGEIPLSPGVYRFWDAEDRVIYVGKAKSLRPRLNSYFADVAGLADRTRRMVTTAVRVDWTVVQTEVEALQLEYSWIKQFDPRFNIKYRDDKSYPWLAVTWADEVPRVFVGRGAKKKGNRYFGPYGHAWAIRDTVDTLLRVFPMRSCSSGVYRNAQRANRPCLLGYIDKCAAPCVGRIGADEHRQIVADFCQFMGGQTQQLTRRLETDMAEAAEAMEYERAARIRDDLAALAKVNEQNAVVLTDGTDADVIGLAEDPLEVSVQIFHVRQGRIRGRRGWVADRADESDTAQLIENFLVQLYGDSDHVEVNGSISPVPREVLVPQLPPEPEVLAELLSGVRGSKVLLRVPQRGDKRALLATVTENAKEALIRHRTRRAGDLTTRNRALEEIRDALGLAQAPLRLECYDISHLQGTEAVGSMVVFEDGLPRKSDYRRFVVRDARDDTSSMREVLTRRFTRYLADRELPPEERPRGFAYAPGLLIVDGGQPQVAAAQDILTELGLTDIPVCGLAKRLEEVWLPDDEYPVILPRSSEGLYLLQRIRDEAHRFAIGHHRGRRSKAMIDSVLDRVPGLGTTRRKALMLRFGSLRKLRAASLEDLLEVPGIGPATAAAILATVRAEEASPAVNTATGEILNDRA